MLAGPGPTPDCRRFDRWAVVFAVIISIVLAEYVSGPRSEDLVRLSRQMRIHRLQGGLVLAGAADLLQIGQQRGGDVQARRDRWVMA